MRRVVEEARRYVVRDFSSARPGCATVQRQVRSLFSVSVTSHATVSSEVSYRVYAIVGRECDFLRGQAAWIRESVDTFAYATTRRSEVSGLEVQFELGLFSR